MPPSGLTTRSKRRILLAADGYVFGDVVRTSTGWSEEGDAGKERFEQGLAWLLDGIAAEVDPQGAS